MRPTLFYQFIHKIEFERLVAWVDRNQPRCLFRLFRPALGLGACWLWTGGLQGTRSEATTRPNATLRQSGTKKAIYIHPLACMYHVLRARISKELESGELEFGHLCHHKLCVNPWHVEPITHARNIQQSHEERDRSNEFLGSNNPAAKCNDELADFIRAVYQAGGHSYAELGRRFNLSGQTIAKIVKGLRWAKRTPVAIPVDVQDGIYVGEVAMIDHRKRQNRG